MSDYESSRAETLKLPRNKTVSPMDISAGICGFSAGTVLSLPVEIDFIGRIGNSAAGLASGPRQDLTRPEIKPKPAVESGMTFQAAAETGVIMWLPVIGATALAATSNYLRHRRYKAKTAKIINQLSYDIDNLGITEHPIENKF